MFDVGFWELALIFVVALVVVGPERMPGLIRTAGQWIGRMQRVARELRAEFEREAHTQEFKALNKDFLEEDRRLKDLARANALPAMSSKPSVTADADTPPVVSTAAEASTAPTVSPAVNVAAAALKADSET